MYFKWCLPPFIWGFTEQVKCGSDRCNTYEAVLLFLDRIVSPHMLTVPYVGTDRRADEQLELVATRR